MIKAEIKKLPIIVSNPLRKRIIELQKQVIISCNSKDYTKNEVEKLLVMSNEGIIFRRGITNFIATHDNEIIGIASITRNGIILSLFVAPEYQGQSLGQKLLSCLEVEAKKLDIEHLWLTSSITAKDFFKSFNYKPLVKAKTNGNIPVLVMSKNLINNKRLEIYIKEVVISVTYLAYSALFSLKLMK